MLVVSLLFLIDLRRFKECDL